MKTQLIEVIWLILSSAAPYFLYNHSVTIYLINNQRERRAMCACLRTNYHENNLQNITTKSNFMPILKSTIQKINNNVIQHSTYKQAAPWPEINQNEETRKL